MAQRTRDIVFIGKCSDCKAGVRLTLTRHWTDTWPRPTNIRFTLNGERAAVNTSTGRSRFSVDCRSCGGRARLIALRSSLSEHKRCGARCISATGPQCECQCDGANHGAMHAA